MILLLGGTGESAAVAEGIAEAGYEVLVSAATDVPLNSGSHANLHRRSGRLRLQIVREEAQCQCRRVVRRNRRQSPVQE